MTTPVPSGIASSFEPAVQLKGRILHSARAVTSFKDTKAGAQAEVLDKRRTYSVELILGPGFASGACSCGQFVQHGPCRHLWAVLTETSKRGKLHFRNEPITRFIDLLSEEGMDDEDVEDVEDDDGWVDGDTEASPSVSSARPPRTPERLDWREALRKLDADSWHEYYHGPARSLHDARLAWSLDLPESAAKDALILQAMVVREGADGRPGRPAKLHVNRRSLAEIPDEEDRLLLGALAGALSGAEYSVGYSEVAELPTTWRIAGDAQRFVIERLARSGRLMVEVPAPGHEPRVVSWLPEPPVRVVLEASPESAGFVIDARLLRGDDVVEESDILFVIAGWVMLSPFALAPITPARSAGWIATQRVHGPIHVRSRDEAAALSTLFGRDDVPELRLSPELGWETSASQPGVAFDISPSNKPRMFSGTLTFVYEGIPIGDDGAATPGARRFVAPASRRIVLRDDAAEGAARARLAALGLTRPPASQGAGAWQVPMKRMAPAATALVREGWRVTASGKTYRAPGTPQIRVVSGIDWFDVNGEVSYGDYNVPLPEILRAARRGDDAIVLGDGSLGMLPAEWLTRHGRMLAMGTIEDESIRFKPTQAMLLDLLLEQQPEANCDATFDRVRTRLRRFDGIEPARQPKGFQGTLRDYQLEGLAWLEFLRDFSFGGCLADDMGVGKTAQVLAMLEARRSARSKEPRRPSLVVVPRSLIFNWLEEARQFTPRLKVADLSHGDRDLAALAKADVGLITYGTLRRDAEHLKDIELDYAILDEAQAIKNAASASAKAARLLNARHRLVMTGTPVENHLGELWSLFEFLNPGMLGASSAFHGARKGLELDDDTRETLSRALRPFLLRRTKSQVAKELPERTEQTLHCQMSDTQARHYRAVADRYRAEILKLVDDEGVAKTRMNVLEALLRLRQIACHPALVDRTRIGEKSGKLTTLLETLGQVIEEGHKALVFSQFTSFLEIVRSELDARGIVHEDLDGSTRDRQARVKRFQTDPSCRVFLISLKAGGVGLNLTAADYVFLLDPWWNPAVEAQAIDRTHRIGQTQRVMAYRLVSTDTVEEHVLELQSRKRALADALLGEDASLLGKLSREDIALLLS